MRSINKSVILVFVITIVLGWCSVAQELDTVSTFDMEKMSRNVNSVSHEGSPIVSADGNKLYFFRTNHSENRYGKEGTQDIWFTEKINGEWSKAVHMGNSLNRFPSNQVCAIVDGGNALLLAGGKNKKSPGFAISEKTGEEWGKPKTLEVPGFSKMNKGVYYGASMTDDRSVMVLYFSEKENSRSSDLYLSKRISGNTYTKPKKLGLSSPQDDLGPFICKDNKTMYFSSGQKGSMGNVDIWEVTRLDETWENWSKPKNMGKPLNSKGFDAYFSTENSFKNAYSTRAHMSRDGGSLDIWHFMKRPVIHIKGKIYDASTNETVETPLKITVLDIGEIDLMTDSSGEYKTKLMDRGFYVFTVEAQDYMTYKDTLDLTACEDIEDIVKDIPLKKMPQNVYLTGTVYNKKTNEVIGANVLIEHQVFPKQKLKSDPYSGVFMTDLKDVGKYRVVVAKEGFYTNTIKVLINEANHQMKVYLSPKERDIILQGNLTNEKTKEPVAGEIRYWSPSGEEGVIKTDGNGFYKEQLPEPGLYKLYSAVEGFMALNDTTTVFIPFDDTEFVKNLALKPIEVGASVRLNEIYFDFDKATLQSQSYAELERVVEFMNFNQSVVVELSGHTDNKGSDAYNQSLSQRRAETVVNYLIEKGIAKERLEPVGYGESKPSVANDTDENRAYNRRVEFTILKV